MPKKPLDPRSTYRKQARKVLTKIGRPFRCAKCGWAPVGTLDRKNNLDCNHKNKVLSDLDPSNLEWLCRTCHRAEDRATEKGISKDEHMEKLYGEGFFL
jgi:hypothetical protein